MSMVLSITDHDNDREGGAEGPWPLTVTENDEVLPPEALLEGVSSTSHQATVLTLVVAGGALSGVFSPVAPTSTRVKSAEVRALYQAPYHTHL